MTSGLLQPRGSVTPPDREPRQLQLGDEDLSDVVDALATDCALGIFRALCVEPMTTSDVAATVETSVQNASYHIEKLQTADLVEAVDTWYSVRGREMAVYAATTDRIVIDAADAR